MNSNVLLHAWLADGKTLAPHLEEAVAKLSSEHSSGISFSQLNSPMMQQFRLAKDEVPDALLFFRMGDFYELFGADAIIAADLCGLSLTSRDKNSANPVPMAGAPVASYKNYIKKCLEAGFKVAICEQVKDSFAANKALIKREIIRILTPSMPGHLLDEESDNSTANTCYLACVLNYKKLFTLSYLDISTGEFRITTDLNLNLLEQELATLKPKEIISTISAEKILLPIIKKIDHKITISRIESWLLNSQSACIEIFCEFFTQDKINIFGLTNIELGIESIAGILFYVKNTQKNILKNLQFIKQYELNTFLIIDNATKNNLNFFVSSTGETKGSLFNFLNCCATSAGSRALMRRLNYPFKDADLICQQHNLVEILLANLVNLQQIYHLLKKTTDLEKLLARATQQSLDPHSLLLLRKTLAIIPELNLLLPNEIKIDFDPLAPLLQLLTQAIVDNPSNIIGKDIIFNKDFHIELNELIELENDFTTRLENLEKLERERCGIINLKIGYTRVFGYYFEISKGKLAQVPSHFLRKQTLANGERFITQELKELEEKFLFATERRSSIEQELLDDLTLQILNYSQALSLCAESIAQLDLAANFALLASRYNWVKPELVAEARISLKNSVHPILMQYSEDNFVANDIELADIHLITGPNMAGKSTIMRQVALSQILCQIGAYVPASKATIGLVDRILTRIGSADHALKNQSTFMVEMLETANLLRLASPNSLLLLDEIGRGTSTYDGLAIAWSILEYLHDKVKARTLFSTHYHELCSVCHTHPNIRPMQMGILEQNSINNSGEKEATIIFSRKYIPGNAAKSYGILVAKLAGMPTDIILRSEEILKNLEK